ncbi:MAG: hypothetical protein E7259_07405 [Lachnospiraceae bacterium]|nr:hypothetical protein [Lachnospiraceae bacterium]
MKESYERKIGQLLQQCIEGFRVNVLVIYDNSTVDLLDAFKNALLYIGKCPNFIQINNADCHGQEPPVFVAEKMLTSDVVVCVTKYSLAHTAARKNAEKKGIPFLSMPDYSVDILSNSAYGVKYASRYSTVKYYTDILTNGKCVKIKSELGTDLMMDIEGRTGNCCPGLTNTEILLGSPPDIEANIAPVENRTNGVIVIDGSITDRRIGILSQPVYLNILNGRIVSIKSDDCSVLECIEEIFRDIGNDRALIVGELGIGFNDKANLCGNMLIDEGTQGCIHFGMGSNWTIGGDNMVNFHLDFVMRNASVFVDDRQIIDKGNLLYEQL